MSTPLPVARTVAEMRSQVAAWRAEGLRIGLVPTMGALHEGHLSLVRLALEHSDRVIATVFVNPTQFGPGEDYSAYPRGEQRDRDLLHGAHCSMLFAPAVEEMYPDGFSTTVTVAKVSEPLEGVARPGHFAGVATVVAKLLLQAGAEVAVFGEKDFQQLAVIRRLVLDLDIPVEIIGAPTARDESGLALSSRNAYLSETELPIARRLNVILAEAARRAAAGEPVSAIEQAGTTGILAAGFDKVDYLAIVRAGDLQPFAGDKVDGPARALVAARLGRTRLIDNMAV